MTPLTKKELEILMIAYKQYNCKDCVYHGDKEVCSCDNIYYKLEKLIKGLNICSGI